MTALVLTENGLRVPADLVGAAVATVSLVVAGDIVERGMSVAVGDEMPPMEM